MGLPHFVSIATTVKDDTSPKLLEHRKKELQERRETYRFSKCMWALVTVCVCVWVSRCVCCASGGSLGLRGFPDASMPKQKLICHKMPDLRMRRGAILSILCTMRRSMHTHTHISAWTHTHVLTKPRAQFRWQSLREKWSGLIWTSNKCSERKYNENNWIV